MKQIIVASAAAFANVAVNSAAPARGIVHDPVMLNIGVNCQWQSSCMKLQRSAMKRTLAYVASNHPPHWKVQLCNHNASRGGDRVDWVGFDHCIRNPTLSRPSVGRTHRWPR
jgi:hypothetical protein